MTDANNMYVGGSALAREWDGDAPAFENANRKPERGAVIELPAADRGYGPDLSAKGLRPIDFSWISPGSPAGDVQQAIDWVNNAAGWFHSVDLPQGIATPGGRGWESRRDLFDYAARCKGKTVLDVGAMEGGDTFAAEDAGATSVTAADVDHYLQYDLGSNAAWSYVVEKHKAAVAQGPEGEWAFLNSKRFGFELCKAARGSNAQRVTSTVYGLDPSVHGVFDVTMCFGLLYHLRHPLLALDRIASVTGEVMLVNNQIYSGPSPHDNAVLYHNDTWRGSYTNWFVPTYGAFLQMLSSSGFRRVEVIDASENTLAAACYK